MRSSFEERLRCPRCSTPAPQLEIESQNGTEVRAGTLACSGCGAQWPVRDGIAELLNDPPPYVVDEAAGLVRFAEVMRADGWDRERILSLPYVQDGYWFAQATLMNQVLDTVDLESGQTLLDVGANTCWASSRFAREGLDVTALDISTEVMQGLGTAEWHFEEHGVYFERVLGSMFDLPFADASFDYVWCCEVLHHNHRANLAKTYREIFRVLKPGGRLIVVNEPLRNLKDPKLDPGHEVAEFDGHEHAYMRFTYTSLARRAGFDVDVRGPRYHSIFQAGPMSVAETQPLRTVAAVCLVVLGRRSALAKRAVLAARAYLFGGTALHMVCTKPG